MLTIQYTKVRPGLETENHKQQGRGWFFGGKRKPVAPLLDDTG